MERKPVFDVKRFGASGDGRTLDTGALNRAVRACGEAGGGTVWVPAGTYLTGTVMLLGDVTLHLDAGARLLGSPDLEDYPELPYTSEFRNRALVAAIGARNVAIEGSGTIDGNGDVFMHHGQAEKLRDFDARYTRQGDAYFGPNDRADDGPLEPKARPGILVLFLQCEHVRVSHIAIRGAPNWSVHVARCDGVLLTGLDIRNSLLVPNADGIDVSRSRNVRISDCNISCGDDGLAFSPCAEGYGPARNEHVVVTNCVIQSRSAGIRLGWDDCGFRDFLFQNIVIRDSNRGIGLYVRGAETLENVVFSNIVIETRLHLGKWWGKAEPIHLSVVPLPAYTGPAFEGRLGKLRGVTFRDVTAVCEQGIVVWGSEESAIEDLLFENVRLTLREGPLQESFGGNFDLRPAKEERLRVFARDIPALYAAHVRGLTLRGFDVRYEGALPDYCRHAVEIESFEDVTIDGFRGRQPHAAGAASAAGGASDAGAAAIVLRRGRKAAVRGSVAAPGTGTFLYVEDVEAAGLFALNDMRDARAAIAPAAHGFALYGNIGMEKEAPSS